VYCIALTYGLGSGEQAKESSATVIEVINQFHGEDIQSLLKRCNNTQKPEVELL
jgi:hypothetical protein